MIFWSSLVFRLSVIGTFNNIVLAVNHLDLAVNSATVLLATNLSCSRFL